MGEHLIAKNGVRNLRSMNQVEFQKTSLQMSLLRLVVLERASNKKDVADIKMLTTWLYVRMHLSDRG
jgi:hypothetical protein